MKKLTVGSKLAYGVGQTAEQIKIQGFDMFVFFYFSQVLGLEAWLTGLAVSLALIFDAFSDPMVGSLSDNFRSRFGRRHPFMYFAAIPLGVFWTLIFFPPAGFGQLGLFLWLATFAILVRTAMTFYLVPHLALGAELAGDYQERTSIVNYRVMFGLLGGVMTSVLGLGFFFPESSLYEHRLLNPEGYPNVAIFGGIVMAVAILIAALGTKKHIPRLPSAPTIPIAFSFSRVFSEFKMAFASPSFRALFFGICFSAVSYGLYQTIAVHMNVFFWRISHQEIAVLTAFYIPAFFTAGALSKWLHNKYDKKPVLMVAVLTIGIIGITPVIAHMLGYFPVDYKGEPKLAYLAMTSYIFGTAVAMIFITSGSMMADVAHENTLKNGTNQEGVFLSAISFSGKLSSGVGHLLAGIFLSLIQFPVKAKDPALIDISTVHSLAWICILASFIGACGAIFYRRYKLTKHDFEQADTYDEATDEALSTPVI